MCEQGINWDESKITGRESKMTQRKLLEGIKTLEEKNNGRIPLNSYNQLWAWQPTIYAYLDKCKR